MVDAFVLSLAVIMTDTGCSSLPFISSWRCSLSILGLVAKVSGMGIAFCALELNLYWTLLEIVGMNIQMFCNVLLQAVPCMLKGGLKKRARGWTAIGDDFHLVGERL
jgi:hypothetical protein